MLRWRLLLGTLLIALVAALGWADMHSPRPGVWLFPLAVVVALAASGELLWMSRKREARPLPWVVYAGNLLIVVSNWFPYVVPSGDGNAWIYPSIAFALGLGMALGGEMLRYRKPGGVTERIAMAVLAQAYVGVLLTFVIQLRFLHGGAWGIPALASLIIVVKMGDIGAYTVGRLVGRHKMAPVLSPGKTFEGAVGGIVFACAGAWLALEWLLPAIVPQGSRPQWLAGGWPWFGVLVGLAGMLGDLAESLLKRDLGCKDSSPWMPGFGGVLDILDSILLAAPVAYGCWVWGVAAS
jgi:phosphatidate cytidylyltransferase